MVGLKGPLCLACDNKNGYFGKYGDCNKCKGVQWAVLRLVITLLFSLLLFIITLYSL